MLNYIKENIKAWYRQTDAFDKFYSFFIAPGCLIMIAIAIIIEVKQCH